MKCSNSSVSESSSRDRQNFLPLSCPIRVRPGFSISDLSASAASLLVFFSGSPCKVTNCLIFSIVLLIPQDSVLSFCPNPKSTTRLPVTRKTTRYFTGPADFIIVLELISQINQNCRWLPLHIEDLIARSDVFFGIAMTFQTPFHLERCVLIGQRHLVDRPVTGRAAHAFGNVYIVPEVNKIRQIVNASPSNRNTSSIAFANRRQILVVHKELRMAVHTGLCRGNSSQGGILDRRMAVTTIDSIVRYMVLMAELNGLLPRHIGPCNVRRSLNFGGYPGESGDNKDRSENTDSGDRIGTAMEYLRHRCL